MKFAITMLSLLISHCLISQNNSGNNESVNTEAVKSAEETINATYSVPSIPALEFLSFDPENISRPTTAREFGASLINGIDESGKVKQGLAIEAKLSKIFGCKVNLEDYQDKKKLIKYIAYNAQVSLGSVATAGDSSNTDVGFGIRITLFDRSDPMRNSVFTRDLGQEILEVAPEFPTLEELVAEKERKKMASAVDSLRKNFAKNNWNASWMTISYARGSRLKGSELNEGNSVGQQFWIAGGLGVGNWGQVGYMIRWLNRIQDGTDIKTQELSIGGKFLVGKPKYNLFAEIAFDQLINKEDLEEVPGINPENAVSWSVGVEFLVANGVWAVAGLGQNAERIVGNNSIQLLSGIRMGISDKSRFTTKGTN